MLTDTELARQCADFLGKVDVRLQGDRSWDIEIRNPHVLRTALTGDPLALGEAYVRGEWECGEIDELVARLARLEPPKPTMSLLALGLVAKLEDGGSRRSARKVGTFHYDIPPCLFEAMLDSRMTYSCGYWDDADDLDQAQEAKLDLVCRKLGLQPGMTVLDIGGGWGSFAGFAAERYGANVTMITVSKQQADLAEHRTRGLPVKVLLQDYRDIEGVYDRLVSIGMFEHVGQKHYEGYMRIAHAHLATDGLFLLHAIGCSEKGTNNPWIERYIFPGGHIPAISELAAALEGHFVMEDWHNFGADYDRTLIAWFHRFEENWKSISHAFPPSFFRRWKLYLQGCAGSFRARQLQLWQLVLSPGGVPGGYRRVS